MLFSFKIHAPCNDIVFNLVGNNVALPEPVQEVDQAQEVVHSQEVDHAQQVEQIPLPPEPVHVVEVRCPDGTIERVAG